MKKIFYIIASAIVALGATACQNDINDVVTPETEGVSINVTIAEQTRVALGELNDNNQRKLTFGEGDVLVVREGWNEGTNFLFNFTSTENDTHTFTCTQEGVNGLVGKEVTAFYLGGLHEKADDLLLYGAVCNTAAESINGISLYGNTVLGETTVTLSAQPVLKFSAASPVTFTSSSHIFFTNEDFLNTYTTTTTGEIYLPILNSGGQEIEFSASIDGEVVKSTTISFRENHIYNLGTIEKAEVEVCDFGIVGGHQGWNTDNMDEMYKIAGSNTYVRRNVTLTADGFKFYGSTTKTVTIEHPAVTTGEEGDWYLQPNSNWKQANARFAIYFFGTSGNTWVSMKDDNGDGIYVANNPATGTYENMIFCRMNPSATANNWNNKWNQTGDLKKPTNGNNCFSVPSGSWDGATTGWSKHTPEVKDAWTEEVEEVTTYWIGKDAADNISTWVTKWSNNGGADNITVADTTKTYDIYFHKGDEQDWGFEIHYVVLESGSPAPELK